MPEITQVERAITQVEIRDQPEDTPRSIEIIRSKSGGPVRAHSNTLLAVAAATQILSSSMAEYFVFSNDIDMTCLNDEQQLAQSADFVIPPLPSTLDLDLPQESEAEVTNRSRLELLARHYVTKKLSPEEDARLAIVTEKIRKLIPRVTIEDFEKLHAIAQESEAIRVKNEERRRRLAI
jgi:hypothetical protein